VGGATFWRASDIQKFIETKTAKGAKNE